MNYIPNTGTDKYVFCNRKFREISFNDHLANRIVRFKTIFQNNCGFRLYFYALCLIISCLSSNISTILKTINTIGISEKIKGRKKQSVISQYLDINRETFHAGKSYLILPRFKLLVLHYITILWNLRRTLYIWNLWPEKIKCHKNLSNWLFEQNSAHLNFGQSSVRKLNKFTETLALVQKWRARYSRNAHKSTYIFRWQPVILYFAFTIHILGIGEVWVW